MMVGDPSKHDKLFNLDEYEEFYEHHNFQPIAEDDAFRVNELIPRFGWAFDEIEELKPKNVLDLGCLDGSFALSVAKQLPGTAVTGVDLTKDGIEIATRRAKEHNLLAVFNQCTIEEYLEHAAEKGLQFDAITCFEVIEHIKDAPYMLKLIDKVLAPGGSVFVSTPAFESPLFGKDDEENKCHIRLYTTADDDYEEANKYGNVRKATSITKEIGPERVKDIGVYSHLINVRYQ